MLLKSIIFVNMTSYVGGSIFLALMKPKSNILDTIYIKKSTNVKIYHKICESPDLRLKDNNIAGV